MPYLLQGKQFCFNCCCIKNQTQTDFFEQLFGCIFREIRIKCSLKEGHKKTSKV